MMLPTLSSPVECQQCLETNGKIIQIFIALTHFLNFDKLLLVKNINTLW